MVNLVCGVGVNDADYVVRPKINGKQVFCPFYKKWTGMIERCYGQKQQENRPTYIGCSVASEWLTFSEFKAWMERQPWQGKELDKDLIIPGNKIYSMDKCVFVDSMTNSFLNECGRRRGIYPLGVSFHSKSNKLKASCNNPFTKKPEYLGAFSDPSQAHEAWRKRKHELACQLAELQDDQRVAIALRSRYIKH